MGESATAEHHFTTAERNAHTNYRQQLRQFTENGCAHVEFGICLVATYKA